MTHDPREALEPFARIPLSHTDDIDDSATVFEYEGGAITLGDLRRVHAALTASPGEQKPVAYRRRRKGIAGTGGWIMCPEKPERDNEFDLEPLYTSPPPAAGWNEAIEAAKLVVERWSLPTIQTPSMWLIDKAGIVAEIEALRRETPAPEGVAKIGPQFDISQSEPEMIWDSDDRPDAGGGVREAFVSVLASLAAAISLLERMPKAKKAAPSDTMFAIMLDDYRKALETGRTALSTPPAAVESNASVEARLREALELGRFYAGLQHDEAIRCHAYHAASSCEKDIKLIDEALSAVGDEAKKSDEAEGTRPVPSVSGNSDREQQRDTTGVTAGETATNQKSEGSPVQPDQGVASQHEYPDESRSGLNSSRNQSAPSDQTAERREIVARFKSVVQIMRSANKQGRLMCIWNSDIETMDAILAALDGGACA